MSGVNSFPTRLIPLKGPEADRVTKAASILEGELHSTTDQDRLFVENILVNTVYHGAVADTAARIALNSTSARGCWVGDLCFQSDNFSFYVCETSPGTSDGNWRKVGEVVTGLTSATGDIIYRNSSGVLTALAIGATNKILKVVGGLPAWATESAGGGGGGTELVVEAYPSSNITLNVNSTWTDVVFNSTNVNESTQYDTSTGVWTVPSDGEYIVEFQMRFYNVGAGITHIRIYDDTNAAVLAYATQYSGNNDGTRPIATKRLTLTEDDEIKFQYYKLATKSGHTFSGDAWQFVQITKL